MLSPGNSEVARLRLLLRAIVLVVGIVEAWAFRYLIFSDGVQYLEIAQKYARGEWSSAVNGYWSPLYSWVLALAFLVLKPSPYFQVATLHLINLLAYCVSLLTFEYFLKQLIALKGETSDKAMKGWLVLAYLIFMWSGVKLIRLAYPSADMIVAAFVYLLQGMLIAIARGQRRSRLFFAAFGALAALAFLSKAAFFGLAPVYLMTAGLLLKNWGRAIRRTAVAAIAFLLVAAPFLLALHHLKGYWTIGEAGKLNYAWEVCGVTRSTHWQGEPLQFGAPAHPTRKLSSSPAVYEFDTPFPVTYSPWYDPSYWYAGVAPRFEPARQAWAFTKNFELAAAIFFMLPGVLPLVLLACVRKRLPDSSSLLLAAPAVAAVLIYSLVFVETRYLGAFLAVLAVTALAEPFWHEKSWPKLSQCIPHIGVATALFALVPVLFYSFVLTLSECVNRREMYPNAQALIGREMAELGLKPGDKVAYIGLGINADWARMMGVRVVSEITVKYEKQDDLFRSSHQDPAEMEKFWALDATGQEQVLALFAATGAKMVVADNVPASASPQGWHKLKTELIPRTGTPSVYARALAADRARQAAGVPGSNTRLEPAPAAGCAPTPGSPCP